ncbi:MAG: helix-turn-helix domain-containing protein [Limimaricola soesokkakensis]|uniref:helix-turn-helix domain-containing protein n=1 Tax=Limimaricola soesokkakensis TaxID=1343159 RepID=UPI004059F9E9
MAVQKHYAGTQLRELRGRIGLTQKRFAERLGVSLPYLNQMENNNRPVSAGVVLALAREFGFDVTELTSGEEIRLASDMREALADPVLSGSQPPLSDLRMVAANAPSVARALLDLHAAYRRAQDRLASFDEALGRAGTTASPWEEVRDFFHYCDNYIDAIDRAAEQFARRAATEGHDAPQAAIQALDARGITLREVAEAPLRRFDAENRSLTLSSRAPRATRRFQLLVQLALVEHRELIEATLDLGRFEIGTARDIARIGLANYFAGAALMPYGAFLDAAQETRHDLELLAERFGASLEQVAHRLSTLQRPGARGVPFWFVRVDQAGTVTKRHSATQLQFARYGGACPLWNVHQAFETPTRWLRQLAETPDGVRYLSLARDISGGGGAWGAPVRRFAIGLGCEVKHARELVYADHMDLASAQAFEPVGISCRICERTNCHQRAVPPLEGRLKVDADLRQDLPYRLE